MTALWITEETRKWTKTKEREGTRGVKTLNENVS